MTTKVEGRTLWELIERRAAATPDARFGDRRGRAARSPSPSTATRAERAAAGLAGARASARATNVSWQLPTWIESLVLVGALVAARRGAEPDAADLPRARGRLHHPADRREAAHRARRCGAASTTRRWPTRSPASSTASRCSSCDQVAARGRPVDAARRPRRGRRRADAGALDLLHVGHDRRPEGRAAHRRARSWPSADAAWSSALELARRRRRRARVPVHPHRRASRGCSPRCMTGCAHMLVVEAFDPATTIPVLRRARASRSPARARRSTWRTSPRSAARPDDAAVPERARVPRRRRAEAAAAALRRRRPSSAASASCRATGSPSARSSRWRASTTPTRSSPTPRAAPMPGRRAQARDARRRGRRRRRGGRDPRQGPAAHAAATSTRRSTPTRSTRTATSAPATSACVDADGYVVITGRLKDIIIRKGENISAKEVEDLLFTHPKVADVAVIGLPDPKPGERACAVVAPKDPADPLDASTRCRRSCKEPGPHGAEDPRAARDRRRRCPATRPARSSSTSCASSTRQGARDERTLHRQGRHRHRRGSGHRPGHRHAASPPRAPRSPASTSPSTACEQTAADIVDGGRQGRRPTRATSPTSRR